MNPISIAIHGGAGTILKKHLSEERERAYRAALDEAIDTAYDLLNKGGSSLDAVEKAVCMLEDSPLFNAGKGSVFTEKGGHEMDASIMDGSNRQAGAVALVSGIKNPVSLARLVMERSEHILLAGEGAMEFAEKRGMKRVPESYFFDEFRHKQWLSVKDSGKVQLDHSADQERKFGTVGAVALDGHGNIAAATSTGGMTNKRFGRIGDSPLIGAGIYANNLTCAVSSTGSGEYFMRGIVAYDISCLMEYKGLSLKEASDIVVHERLLAIGGDGGIIAVDKRGNLALPFNTPGMYRASRSSLAAPFTGIYA